MKSTPEQQALGEAFAQECRADGRMIQRGVEKCTRRWKDKDALFEYKRLTGSGQPCRVQPPDGSIPLKRAIMEVAEALGMSFNSFDQVRWEKRYRLPFRIMRRLRTRVDVDPASIPAAIAWMREGRFRAGNAGTNGKQSRAIPDGEQPAFAGRLAKGNPRDDIQ